MCVCVCVCVFWAFPRSICSGLLILPSLRHVQPQVFSCKQTTDYKHHRSFKTTSFDFWVALILSALRPIYAAEVACLTWTAFLLLRLLLLSVFLSFHLSIFKKIVIILSLSSSQKQLWRMLWAADAILSRRNLADRLNQPEIILRDFGFSSVNMHEQPQSKQDVLRRLSSRWETLRYGRHIWPVTGAGTLLMDTPLKAQE